MPRNSLITFLSTFLFLVLFPSLFLGCSFIINQAFTPAPASDVPRTPLSPNANLIITEVGSTEFTNLPIWFEIYNPSTNIVANLSDYSFNSFAVIRDSSGVGRALGNLEFILPSVTPSVTLGPQSYMVVRGIVNELGTSLGVDYEARNRANNGIIFVNHVDGFYPFFSANRGHIELIYNRTSVIDYLEFGAENAYRTSDASQWQGASITGSVEGYGYALARKYDATTLTYQDNNDASDWQLTAYATRGGPNDVIVLTNQSNVDADQDGIPDVAEAQGRTFNGLPLYDWGARPGQRDIFIEIDHMAQGSATGIGNFSESVTLPARAALEKIARVFSGKGFTLHFDVGDLFDANPALLNPGAMDLGGGNEIPFSPGISLREANSSTRVNFFDVKHEHMAAARRQIFFYMVLANSLEANGSNGSTGEAEVNGNDAIIALGSYGNGDDGFGVTDNVYINLLAATIMHELGHNLGLKHGGDVDVNYKPNYVSTMNYLYSLEGLPTIGNGEGDRYYLENYSRSNSLLCATKGVRDRDDLLNNVLGSPNGFIIDYSDGSGITFDERGPINENLGLGRTGSVAVDYNCNGVIENSLFNLNLNNSHDTVPTQLTDYNDWGNIDVVFRRRSSGDSGRALVSSTTSVSSTTTTPRLVFDPILQDEQQEIIVERKETQKRMMERILRLN